MNDQSASSRRALVREYKNAFPSMGIFAVRCAANGEVWIGASRNLEGAINRARFQFKLGSHRNAALAQAGRRYGWDSLDFEILDRVKQRDDPQFDYDAELRDMLELWRAEMGAALKGVLV